MSIGVVGQVGFYASLLGQAAAEAVGGRLAGDAGVGVPEVDLGREALAAGAAVIAHPLLARRRRRPDAVAHAQSSSSLAASSAPALPPARRSLVRRTNGRRS